MSRARARARDRTRDRARVSSRARDWERAYVKRPDRFAVGPNLP